MRERIPRAFGSALLLFGAFAVGGVLHAVLVEGTIDPLAPPAIGGILLGALLLAVGVRLERAFDPSEYVPADEPADDGEAFDERLSPVSEERLAGRDADEEYDRE